GIDPALPGRSPGRAPGARRAAGGRRPEDRQAGDARQRADPVSRVEGEAVEGEEAAAALSRGTGSSCMRVSLLCWSLVVRSPGDSTMIPDRSSSPHAPATPGLAGAESSTPRKGLPGRRRLRPAHALSALFAALCVVAPALAADRPD